jgi:hypothetical protein
MSHFACTTCKILLATLGFWANLCSSYGSSLGNVTAPATNSHDSTHQFNGNALSSPDQNLTGTFLNAVNTSHSSMSVRSSSSSQSGCSYILRYVTYWPGPYTITQTDSTVCPSLASKTITRVQPKGSETDHMQHLQCHPASMQLRPFHMAMACTTAQHLRPAVHTTILPATSDVLISLRHAAVNGPSGPLRTAFFLFQRSHPLLSSQQRSHRKATLIPTLLCSREKLELLFNTLSQSANQL